MIRHLGCHLIVTKPSDPEHPFARPTTLFYDYKNETVGIRIEGDNPLKGTLFELRLKDINDVVANGTLAEELPPIEPEGC